MLVVEWDRSMLHVPQSLPESSSFPTEYHVHSNIFLQYVYLTFSLVHDALRRRLVTEKLVHLKKLLRGYSTGHQISTPDRGR